MCRAEQYMQAKRHTIPDNTPWTSRVICRARSRKRSPMPRSAMLCTHLRPLVYNARTEAHRAVPVQQTPAKSGQPPGGHFPKHASSFALLEVVQGCAYAHEQVHSQGACPAGQLRQIRCTVPCCSCHKAAAHASAPAGPAVCLPGGALSSAAWHCVHSCQPGPSCTCISLSFISVSRSFSQVLHGS